MKRKHMTQPDHPVHPVNADDPDLTKREYFAAMAMQGVMASDAEGHWMTVDCLAKYCVESADALINALNIQANEDNSE